ncbi:lytic transglycosylase domain-containing protein [Limnohabitans sp. Jir72]|uniref:lytic transglycosylase domain-containing protein n=1 Tax=Limnohabitans sp. Jir72 TaxID=1977909 RepID=UPI001E450EF7|nr:lytic transglycosylase domain-containing protein [Limnohabitans sp. Jir72]
MEKTDNLGVREMLLTSAIGDSPRICQEMYLRFALFLMVDVLMLVPTAWADSYAYNDVSTGVIHLTDRPLSNDYELLLKSPAELVSGNETKLNQSKMFLSRGVRRKELEGLVAAASHQSGVQPELLHAVISVESDYDQNAMSSKGALGLMQLMPETARRYGVSNRRDPAENLMGGARYLAYLLAIFNQNVKLAVAAYNAGENAVIKYGYQIPPYKETENYVKKVSVLYEQYRKSLIQ